MKRLLTISLLMLMLGAIRSQDLHFAQYRAIPLLYSPAGAGLGDADYRLGLAYRGQWAGSTSVNSTFVYNSFATSYDHRIQMGGYRGNYLGIGGLLLADVAGDSRFRHTELRLSLSFGYRFPNLKNGLLAIGIQGGWFQSGLDNSILTFDNQFVDRLGFDGGIGGDPVQGLLQQANGGDAGMGMAFSTETRKSHAIYLLIGAQHLNEANSSLIKGELIKRFALYSLQAGTSFKLSNEWSLIPSVLAAHQGSSQELFLSMAARYRFERERQIKSVNFGLGARYKDAIAIQGGLHWQQLKLSVSYEINVSGLRAATRSIGGPEISLRWEGMHRSRSGKRQFDCPFYF